jgi:diaminopimelate decarboxylase
VGKTTYSRDILARCRLPNDICVGDLLVFEDAGAYCSSMTSRFLGQVEPAVIIIDDCQRSVL